MFVGYVFVLLVCLVSAKEAATFNECNYKSGHGMVLLSSKLCNYFVFHHLGEFECPHSWDVKVEVAFENQSEQSSFCKIVLESNQTTFTLAPEFFLPSFFTGNGPSIISNAQVFSGFFTGDPVINVTLRVVQTLFYEEYGMIMLPNLTYNVLPLGNDELLLWHRIGIAPDFDHGKEKDWFYYWLLIFSLVLRVSSDFSFPTSRKWPMLVEFPFVNTFDNRLQEGSKVHGFIGGLQYAFAIEENIYPGADKLNGDGKTDFQQYCVVPSRPKWHLCP